MSEPTEAETIEYLKQLMELETEGERTQISIGPYTAFLTISALQLAGRHPAMHGTGVAAIRRMVDQLMPLFAGTYGEQLIRMGEHPEFDVEQEPRNGEA